MNDKIDEKYGSRHGFFAVDRRAWAAVCKLSSINAPVAYLVMASGTLRDHRTTSWSVNSIEKYTGIGRHNAKIAIERLVTAGLIKRTQDGTRPRYYIVPPHEVPRCEGFARPVPEEHWEKRLLADLRALKPDHCMRLPKKNKDRHWAERLVAAGLAEQDGDEFVAVPYDAEAAQRPDWIWLPRTCIEGAASETPAIELLRQSQNLAALRLFVDLYHAQSLPRYGGISWRHLRVEYTREKLGEQGTYVVWGFKQALKRAWAQPLVAPHLTGNMVKWGDSERDAGWDVFYDALEAIISLGLAEFVEHVIEADSDEASVLFPYGIKSGLPEEQLIARAAHEAGLRMILDGKAALASKAGMCLVPIRKHYGQATMVGLLRLRYQAFTEVNAEWVGQREGWVELAREMDKLGRPVGHMQHQVDINSESNRFQIGIKEYTPLTITASTAGAAAP